MTQTEKQELLSRLGAEEADLITKLQMKQDERRALEATPVTTPHKVWEPAIGEDYWDSSVCEETFYRTDSHVDECTIETGLAHRTHEEADRHHEFLVMLHDLHKFAVEHNEGWKPDLTTRNYASWHIEFDAHEGLESDYCYGMLPSPLPCFKSEEIAQKAIDTFGDRLKILFEYYNS